MPLWMMLTGSNYYIICVTSKFTSINNFFILLIIYIFMENIYYQ
jgi:hypothetical protein